MWIAEKADMNSHVSSVYIFTGTLGSLSSFGFMGKKKILLNHLLGGINNVVLKGYCTDNGEYSHEMGYRRMRACQCP